MSSSSVMWVEKYRPQKISELVNQKEIVGSINSMLKNQSDLPHLLFSGSKISNFKSFLNSTLTSFRLYPIECICTNSDISKIYERSLNHLMDTIDQMNLQKALII